MLAEAKESELTPKRGQSVKRLFNQIHSESGLAPKTGSAKKKRTVDDISASTTTGEAGLLRSQYKTRDLIKFYFEQSDDPNLFICRNPNCHGAIKQNIKSGYTNLKNHLISCVGSSYQERFEAMMRSEGVDMKTCENKTLSSFGWVNNNEVQVYKVLRWIVMQSMPISEVENELTRSLMGMKPMSAKTVRNYLVNLTEIVEGIVTDFLPQKFVVQFDAWTCGSRHYFASIACFWKDCQYKERLLGISPLEDETSLCAENNAATLKAHLETHHRLPSDIIALVGDHAAVNGCISNKIKCPIIGCASHRFNLAVDCWLEKNPRYMEIIELVWEVMKKARTLKVAAKLRDLECLAAVDYIKTRWSSKWVILNRYLKIENRMKSISDLEDMMFSGSKKRALLELADHF